MDVCAVGMGWGWSRVRQSDGCACLCREVVRARTCVRVCLCVCVWLLWWIFFRSVCLTIQLTRLSTQPPLLCCVYVFMCRCVCVCVYVCLFISEFGDSGWVLQDRIVSPGTSVLQFLTSTHCLWRVLHSGELLFHVWPMMGGRDVVLSLLLP